MVGVSGHSVEMQQSLLTPPCPTDVLGNRGVSRISKMARFKGTRAHLHPPVPLNCQLSRLPLAMQS